MKKYSLSEFGLNKQSLKRKLDEIQDVVLRKNVENILNERTTKFDLSEIEYVIDCFYSDKFSGSRKKSEQPLSIYYKNQNKEKYQKLKTLISIKKDGNSNLALEREIRNVVTNSIDTCVDFDVYNEKLEMIADKFGILPKEVYKIIDRIENEWLNDMNKITTE